MRRLFSSLCALAAFLLCLDPLRAQVLKVDVTTPVNESSVTYRAGARQARALASVGSGAVTGIALTDYGTGYTSAPAVIIEGGGGTGATATATLAGGSVSAINIVSSGSGYTSAPSVTIAPPAGVLIITGFISGTPPPYKTRFYVDGLLVGKIDDHTSTTVSSTWTPPQPGAYFVSISTSDDLGNTTTSLPVRVFVEGTKVTSPIANTLVPNGSSVIVSAEATKAQGFIRQIEFFVDGASIGVDTTAPYSVPYTPANGIRTYNLTAQATDNAGNLMTVSDTVPVQVVAPVGLPPIVRIVNPVPGSTLSPGTAVSIIADASDSDGFITKVDFYLNGALLGTDQTFPYTTSWTPGVAGTYKLDALAYDDKGNAVAAQTAVITVRAGLPTIAVTNITSKYAYSTDKVLVGTPLQITVDAKGADGGIGTLKSISLLIDGKVTDTLPKNPDNLDPPPALSEPFLFDWTSNIAVGAHTIAARVTDQSGISITSSEIAITVVDNLAPEVTITSPLDSGSGGPALSLGNVFPINATAIDRDGSVAKVAFSVNGQLVGTLTAAPYSVNYTPSQAGTYQLSVVATDNLGKSSAPATVSVTVRSPVGRQPYVGLTFNDPSVDADSTEDGTDSDTTPIEVAYGSKLLLCASALDEDGSIVSVDFYANGNKVATRTSAPYTLVYAAVSAGSLELRAVATDNDGNSVGSIPLSLSIVPVGGTAKLKVDLVSPLDGASYAAGEQIAFAGTSNVGDTPTPKIDIFVNGLQFLTMKEAPYTKSMGLSVAGDYEIRAVVRQDNFTTVSAPAYIRIRENGLPSVSIVSPANGVSALVGSSVKIQAQASDKDGTISSVEFYVNGSSVGSSTASPYSVLWTPASEGIHRLTAIARDNSGAAATSPTVSLIVTGSGSGRADTVYGGTQISGFETWRYSLLVLSDNTAVFVASSLSDSSKTYCYSGISIDSDGYLRYTDGSGKTLLTGTVSATGFVGTFTPGSQAQAFIVPVSLAGANPVPPGLYNGSVSGRSSSSFTGIVGGNGSFTVYLADGSNKETGSATLASDGSFSVTATSGSKIAGKIDPASGFVTGTVTGPISGSLLAAMSSGATLSDSSIRGLSTRGYVGTGDNVLIAGFIVEDPGSKTLVLRGMGPSLGVAGGLPNPLLEGHDGGGVMAPLSNDDWSQTPATLAALSRASLGTPGSPRESVSSAGLGAGAYTVILKGSGESSGVGLVEIYDGDAFVPFASPRLRAISTRGYVGTGDDVMIAGFTIAGTAPIKVLIKAVGPTLASLNPGMQGVLQDPVLTLVNGSTGKTVRENDDWEKGNDLVSAASVILGAAPLPSGSKDAAILIRLPPGPYTAIVRGAGGASGVAVVEVYEVR